MARRPPRNIKGKATGVPGVTYDLKDGSGNRGAAVTVMVKGVDARLFSLIRDEQADAQRPKPRIPLRLRRDLERDYKAANRTRTPIDTGRLRRSFGVRFMGAIVELRWPIPYAAYPDRRGRSKGWVNRMVRDGTRRADRSIRHSAQVELGLVQRGTRRRVREGG